MITTVYYSDNQLTLSGMEGSPLGSGLGLGSGSVLVSGLGSGLGSGLMYYSDSRLTLSGMEGSPLGSGAMKYGTWGRREQVAVSFHPKWHPIP